MNYDEFKYVILTDNKNPVHKFKDGGKSWDEVKDFDNIAVIVPEPYVVIDFDTVSDAAIAQKIVKETGLRCRIMKTTRGVHIWVKSSVAMKNAVKAKLSSGIYADFRSWGRACYVKIKDKGQLREWIKEDEELDEIPCYFKTVGNTGKSFKFKGMGDGDGRNQELFNYVLFLQSNGYKQHEIREIIRLVNKFVLADPLPDKELKGILRDDAFKTEEEVQELKEQYQAGKFDHAQMAKDIVTDNHIITVNNLIYMYQDGYYQPANLLLEQELINRCTNIKISQRKEVIDYIRVITSKKRDQILNDPYVVNVENGRLDLRTGKLGEHTPDAIDFERVPVTYDPMVKNEDVNSLLSSVFCEKDDCMQLFKEILGDILLHKNIYQKAFLFVGDGSNGKSTILRMMRSFIGEINCSTLGLDDLSGHFRTAELCNKLLNLGDDLENRPVKNSGMIKKIFSGEPMVVEKKFADPFVLQSYATHVFSCNEIPANSDRSDGMYRRWIIVPFDARFSPNDESYDPYILEKVTTKEAKSYLLNLAVSGYRSLSSRGYFIEPESAKLKKTDFVIENSPILSWIDDKDITLNELCSEPRDTIYDKYVSFSTESRTGYILSRAKFYKEIQKRYNLISRQKKDGKRYFTVNMEVLND